MKNLIDYPTPLTETHAYDTFDGGFAANSVVDAEIFRKLEQKFKMSVETLKNLLESIPLDCLPQVKFVEYRRILSIVEA